MDGFVGLLIMLGIALFAAGPLAVILAIVLFNKLGSINRRLNKLEGKTKYGSYGTIPPKPAAAAKPVIATPRPTRSGVVRCFLSLPPTASEHRETEIQSHSCRQSDPVESRKTRSVWRVAQ